MARQLRAVQQHTLQNVFGGSPTGFSTYQWVTLSPTRFLGSHGFRSGSGDLTLVLVGWDGADPTTLEVLDTLAAPITADPDDAYNAAVRQTIVTAGANVWIRTQEHYDDPVDPLDDRTRYVMRVFTWASDTLTLEDEQRYVVFTGIGTGTTEPVLEDLTYDDADDTSPTRPQRNSIVVCGLADGSVIEIWPRIGTSDSSYQPTSWAHHTLTAGSIVFGDRAMLYQYGATPSWSRDNETLVVADPSTAPPGFYDHFAWDGSDLPLLIRYTGDATVWTPFPYATGVSPSFSTVNPFALYANVVTFPVSGADAGFYELDADGYRDAASRTTPVHDSGVKPTSAQPQDSHQTRGTSFFIMDGSTLLLGDLLARDSTVTSPNRYTDASGRTIDMFTAAYDGSQTPYGPNPDDLDGLEIWTVCGSALSSPFLSVIRWRLWLSYVPPAEVNLEIPDLEIPRKEYARIDREELQRHFNDAGVEEDEATQISSALERWSAQVHRDELANYHGIESWVGRLQQAVE